MELFNALTETEKSMMERYIDRYAFSGDDGTRKATLEYLMRVWDRSKDSLYQMFGRQFILSKDVIFTRSEQEMAEELEGKFYGWGIPEEDREFVNAYMNMIDEHSLRYDTMWMTMRGMVAADSLASNVYHGVAFEFPNPKNPDKPIKVSHGGKVTRILGKVAEAYDLPGFEHFRILHSQVLNQKKLGGNLCLSIHPLDYMTMSDNECGWCSCMSWNDYGCYRQGTVEMMNSPCVVVAYLTADDDMYMPGDYHWNNKKWRQLFIVRPEMISNIKAYPYRNDELTFTVLEWLKELAAPYFGTEYTKNIAMYSAFENSYIDELDCNVDIRPSTYQMYNDLSDEQFAFFDKDLEGTLSFYFSGESECMSCGSTCCDFDGEGALVCDNCECRVYCDGCGEYYSSDEGFVEVDDQWYCPYCAEHYCDEDTFTGELHHCDNMSTLYILGPDGKTLHDVGARHYYSLFMPVDLADYMKRMFVYEPSDYPWSRYRFARIEDLTEDGVAALGFKDKEALIKHIELEYTYSLTITDSDDVSVDWE